MRATSGGALRAPHRTRSAGWQYINCKRDARAADSVDFFRLDASRIAFCRKPHVADDVSELGGGQMS